MQKPIKDICVDFDGTCVKHAYPSIGDDIGAQKVLRRLVDEGCRLILFTMRSDILLRDAVRWFEDNEIPLYGIQTNPRQLSWTTSPKAYGQLYIDDAGLGCPVIYPADGDRPYVDWDAVEAHLERIEVLTPK